MTMWHFNPAGFEPTPEQRAIQCADAPHVVVQANAGAAKTTTLALRIGEALARGMPPAHIVALTYTEPAVQALQASLERVGVPARVAQAMQLRTVDRFSAECLERLEGKGVAWLDTPEQVKPRLLQAVEALREAALEQGEPELPLAGVEAWVEGLLADFLWLKGTLALALQAPGARITPAVAADVGMDPVALRLFRAHEALRYDPREERPAFRSPGDATYDLAMALRADDPPFLDVHPLRLGFELVVLDEMHDTNRAMFTVLQHLLAQNPQAAFVGVGDAHQVIHKLAGADATFMRDEFDRTIGVPLRPPLSASYRAGPALAAAAGRVAGKPFGSRSGWETDIRVLPCEDDADQVWQVAQAVRQARNAVPPGSRPSVAVLLRQAHLSIALENHFLDHNPDGALDYRTAGFDTYLQRPELLFVRGLLAQAAGDFEGFVPGTLAAVLRALFMFTESRIDTGQPERDSDARWHATQVEAMAADARGVPAFVENQVLRNARPATRERIEAALQAARGGSAAWPTLFLAALQAEQIAERVLVRAIDVAQAGANVAAFIATAADYQSAASFLEAINGREQRLVNLGRGGRRNARAGAGSSRVLLATVEAVKGLEFDEVVMPGLNRGEFAIGGDSTDNRNLFYVGITRARRRLTLLHRKGQASAYLRDAGLLPGA
ncbi:UvrD-helicase domain-containing protein [Ideonella sp. BN130291]|uniref:UvrD-helicase domain-containing protein n=1 Tax=Ideonella sp. BN130291 TaxID=3112940 RepID=UPI002E260879|nr:UvrD-helicase domain-containing protein [Ideonella sp. BN130291]